MLKENGRIYVNVTNGSAHAVVVAGCCLADCELSSVLSTQTPLLSCSFLSTTLLICFLASQLHM